MQSQSRPETPGHEEGRPFGQRLLGGLLHLYFRLVRGLTFGVRAAVLNERNEVFLVRHGYIPGWYLPGGGVEVGETMWDALERELAEEGNIAIKGPAILHGIFFNGRISRRDHVAVFVIRSFVVEGVRQPDREIAETGFFPLDRLPEGTTPATRRRLDEIIAGKPAAAEW
ncbi:ADP-ribose pyrophosphatase YjhB, NUDIX family OS=Bosea thiooxidans OX=53254 GN=SAMN05660750_00525 PE=4 SV=1 [Bosea thiooxidans]|uniref:ADP-ribose pyrophosphatase YjhB, NUDIX family n=1 Tax=Bosea thiooxidans TaxID=53254 RepID=A0A1T5AW81_9HYPH|nr:NUDIX domain-containing protein [Bosea thiooxidans]SKB39258.1 ADP-ribose pyrophosphatase YjhB, NUDIX family [Bosea thiooxidans]